MAQVQFYRVTADQLTSLAQTDGRLIFTTDTHKLYLDNGTDRIQIDGVDFTYGLSLSGQTISITKNDGNSSITLPIVTTTSAGFMSAADKIKLDGIAEGATNVTIDSAMSSTSTNPVQNSVIYNELNGKLDTSLKGAASGLAELDSSGKVPSSQLPSYVDDVLEYDSSSDFPTTGETGKIYVATDTNLTYRWSGSSYIEISESLALGETSSTAYRGDYGAAAYKHAVTNKGSAFDSGLYKITTNSEGHVTAATAVTKSDITGLGIPSSDTNTTYSAGTGLSLSGTIFSNSGVRSIKASDTNGTISVDTGGTSTEILIPGLDTAAYTSSDNYTSSEILPNNNGEIKTKYRISKKLNTGSNN